MHECDLANHAPSEELIMTILHMLKQKWMSRARDCRDQSSYVSLFVRFLLPVKVLTNIFFNQIRVSLVLLLLVTEA